MASKQQGSTKLPAAAAGDFDPKFEWIDNAANYVLRINLQGFKKDDFRVQVDGAGRLTVRGQRPAGGPSFHKVFQLPSTASLDDISGRFDASVLILTVPKRASAAAPTTIEEIKMPKAKQEGAKPPPRDLDGAGKKDAGVVKPKEEITNEDAFKKALNEATRKVQQQQHEEANRRKQEQKPAPAVRTMDEEKPKAPEAAAAPPEKPAPKTEAASGEKAKAIDRESLAGRSTAVDRESLAERVRRRGEEERAAAEEAEREKKTACGGSKERVAGELEELADMKWADGLVEMARNNKEVVAAAITAAIAAFSLGFFVSQKLLSRR